MGRNKGNTHKGTKNENFLQNNAVTILKINEEEAL
jgi:hypothetical protein